MLTKVFTKTLGRATVHRKGGPVPGQISFHRCRTGLLMENFESVDRQVCMSKQCCDLSSLPQNASFGEMPSTRVDRHRALQPRPVVWWWLVARVCEALRYWMVKELGQVISLTNGHRFHRGQQVQAGWSIQVLPGCGTLRSSPGHNGRNTMRVIVEHDRLPATW